MKLRTYQQEAVDSVYRHMRARRDNPCVVLPTGAGKSILMATICKDAALKWRGRALILAHVKELLEQTAGTLRKIAPDLPVGVYSAGLNSRDTKEPVIIAGIQSVAEKACELGRFDLVIVDEAHLIPPSGEGRYQTFLHDARIVNPNIRIIGLTATPYRMAGGMICAKDNVLNHICYDKSIKELIREGFLCSIHTKVPAKKIDCSKLHVRNGEFVASEVSELFDGKNTVHEICLDIFKSTANRNSILVFASSVAQAHCLKEVLYKMTGEEIGLITGDTPGKERANLIARFQRKQHGLFDSLEPLRWLVNVNVLTTGFDAPNVDCVVLVRPTASPGLYYQMVGRGFRIHESKTDCLVLDYGGNIQRHGPVDAIQIHSGGSGAGAAPVKECPECHTVMGIGISRCSDCGHVFPIEESPSKLKDKASRDGILSGQKTEKEYTVQEVHYRIHHKKDALPDDPRTLRVSYEVGVNEFVTEWVCPEHQGWVWQNKFVPWWKKRSNLSPPTNVDIALEYAKRGYLAMPQTLIVIETAGERFPEIIGNNFTEIPDVNEVGQHMYCGDCTHYDVFGSCREKELYDINESSTACESFAPIAEEALTAVNYDDVPF